jgi:hypothetical protein
MQLGTALKPNGQKEVEGKNLGSGCGISRSERNRQAKPPKKKKRMGGVRMFERISEKSMATGDWLS